MEEKKEPDVRVMLNVKEEDMDILKGLLKPGKDRNEFFQMVDADTNEGKVVTISAAEYKSFVFLDFFVQAVVNNRIDRWIPYNNCVEYAERMYNMMLNISERSVKRIEKKLSGEEESSILVTPDEYKGV